MREADNGEKVMACRFTKKEQEHNRMIEGREHDKSKYQNWIDPAEVTPYERNAKVHTDKQIENVANSIRRFGWQQDTVLTSDNVLVIGHGRRLAALRLGCKMPYHRIDKTADELTDEDIRELRIADNATNAETGFDFDLLEMELDGLSFEGFDFDFMEAAEEPEAEEDDFLPVVPEEPRSRLGDIYQLGRHRLMCGDSTSADSVQTLVGGVQIDLFLTDPPYNVALGMGGSVDEARKRHRRTDGLVIMNDKMEDSEFRRFLTVCFTNANRVMKPGAAFYIWHADNESYNFRGAVTDAGLERKQTLVWVKNVITLGRQDYQWKHEPCLYGWKGGAAHYFIDDRTQGTVLPDRAELDPKKMKKDELVKLAEELLKDRTPTTVLREDKPSRSELHPTMKPVKLISRQILNSSRQGEKVLDLFGGSGTTLICCEQLNRDCYMMELDPRYCDVIVDRWEAFTGEKAVLLERKDKR